MSITVRRAEAADAQSIGAVFDAAVKDGWGYLGDVVREPVFNPEDWDRLVADHQPPSVLLVAIEDTGRVVGYAAAHPEDGELNLLFVHPEHGGRGIGRLLLDAAEAALREAGCREAFIFTEERNERALAVYAAAGYLPDGQVRESDFRGQPIREPRLVKPL